VILGLGHSYTVDWWAVGVLVFEMLTGCPPFNADTAQEVFARILDGRIPWPSDGGGDDADDEDDEDDEDAVEMTPVARDFITRLLDANPKRRLGANGADEVKAHAFFAGLDWDTLLEQDGPFVPQLDTPDDTSYFEKRGNDDDYTIDAIAHELGGFATNSPYCLQRAAAAAESAPAVAAVAPSTSSLSDAGSLREPSPPAASAARPIVPPLPLHLTRRLRSMSASMAALDDTVCALPAGRRRSFVAKLDNATPRANTPRSGTVTRHGSRINTARSNLGSAPTSTRDSCSVQDDVDAALQSADSDADSTSASSSSSTTTSSATLAKPADDAAGGNDNGDIDDDDDMPTQVIRVPPMTRANTLVQPDHKAAPINNSPSGGADYDDDPEFQNFSFKNLPHLEALNRQLIAAEVAQRQRRRPMSLLVRNTQATQSVAALHAPSAPHRFASDVAIDAPRRAASTPHRHRLASATHSDDDDDDEDDDDDDDDDEDDDAGEEAASGAAFVRSKPIQIRRRTRKRRTSPSNKLDLKQPSPSPIKGTPTRTFGSPIKVNSPLSPHATNLQPSSGSSGGANVAKLGSPSKRLFARRSARPAAALSPR
jgi:hypothetical protein